MTQNKSNITFYQYIYEWLQCLVLAMIPAIFILTFIVHSQTVSGDSMVPTLENGERMLVSNLFNGLKTGDIIVFSKADFKDGTPLVKRVIATAGQTVNIDKAAGTVTVDGILLHENYISEPTHTLYDVVFPLMVPDGCVFVMGDNRNNSLDSRHSDIGFVDTREILGKVYAILSPFSRIQWFG